MIALKRAELKQMLDSGESFSLINVLESEQFEKTHIPGSINIPVKSKDFVGEVEQIVGDKDAKIVVYCASFECTASPTAAKKLDQAGFSQVFDYEGGLKDWKEGGLATERV